MCGINVISKLDASKEQKRYPRSCITENETFCGGFVRAEDLRKDT